MLVSSQAVPVILAAYAENYPAQVIILEEGAFPVSLEQISALAALPFRVFPIDRRCGAPCNPCLNTLVQTVQSGNVVMLLARNYPTLRHWQCAVARRLVGAP